MSRPQPTEQVLIDYVNQIVAQKHLLANGKPTKAMQLLIADLEKERERDPQMVERLIQRAQANYYDDYLGCDLPQLSLMKDAESLPNIVAGVLAGKYDD
jgi:hypothetical protein